MARSLWIYPRRAGPAAEERQGDDQEGPDDKTDEYLKEGARTGEGAGRVGAMFFFSRKLRERVLLKNSCSIDRQHDKTIADHQPLTTANDKTIADHQPLTTANDKNDKTIADHQPLTTANDKTMRRSAEKIC